MSKAEPEDVDLDPRDIDPTAGCRDGYRVECTDPDCGEVFSADAIPRIADRAATHWNREHGDKLRHSYEQIDTVQYGGHHITGNSYEVRKYGVYVTSFDIVERFGAIDGFVSTDDSDRTCESCLCIVPDPDARVDFESPAADGWVCTTCIETHEINRRRDENQSLHSWEMGA